MFNIFAEVVSELPGLTEKELSVKAGYPAPAPTRSRQVASKPVPPSSF